MIKRTLLATAFALALASPALAGDWIPPNDEGYIGNTSNGGYECEHCTVTTYTVSRGGNHWPENFAYSEAFRSWDAEDGVADGVANLPTRHTEKNKVVTSVPCPDTDETATLSSKSTASPSSPSTSAGNKKS